MANLWREEHRKGAAQQVLAGRARVLLLELELAGFAAAPEAVTAACEALRVLDPSGAESAAFRRQQAALGSKAIVQDVNQQPLPQW